MRTIKIPKISVNNKLKSELLAIFICDKNQDKYFRDILDSHKKDFEGKKNQTLFTYDKLYNRILFLGLGKKHEYSTILKATSNVIATAKSMKLKEISLMLPDSEIMIKAATQSCILSNYDYNFKKEKPHEVQTINLVIDGKKDYNTLIKQEIIIAEGTLIARELVNVSATDKFAENIAKYVKTLAKVGFSVEIWNKKKIEQMKMGGILAVNQGSSQEPRFLILKYNKKQEKPVVLIGKGITFDTGGVQIKPGQYMVDMKSDMAGAAAVISTLFVAAKLKLKRNLIGLIPLTDNAIGSKSYLPGDIITMMSGSTVEIIHTDAEGRLILADALHYSTKLKPQETIDLATLTGACVMALGDEIAGIMGNNKKLITGLFNAGEKVEEKVWELPLYDNFKEDIKGDQSDLKNVPSVTGGNGGTMSAAAFLEHFAKDNWAHIDIAGPAWSSKKKGHISKGGTGFGVRLLIEYLKLS